jgi:hypothetical protein
METTWESEIAAFLAHLSNVQERTLEVLARKGRLLAAADTAGLAAMESEEQELIAGLQDCLHRREELLDRAAQEGLPSQNVRALAQAVGGRPPSPLDDQVRLAAHRQRLLQHQSLVNWVLVQKTLIHLSQLLEIIATGGRLQPTYHKDSVVQATGALVDHAA